MIFQQEVTNNQVVNEQFKYAVGFGGTKTHCWGRSARFWDFRDVWVDLELTTLIGGDNALLDATYSFYS